MMRSVITIGAKRKQSGFTIIELVVVILLLGILAAVALPRFMDVTDEAHTAVVDAVEAGLRTGTALFKAQWTAEGEPLTAVDIGGFGLVASADGYPKSVTGTLAETDCAAIYNALLQDGRPLAVSATVAYVAPGPLLSAALEAAIEGGAGATTDIVAVLNQESPIADSESCTYFYVGQYKAGTDAVRRTLPTITYYFETGDIVRANTYELKLDTPPT